MPLPPPLPPGPAAAAAAAAVALLVNVSWLPFSDYYIELDTEPTMDLWARPRVGGREGRG